MPRCAPSRRPPLSRARGFTLIEAAIATMIVGSGIVAVMGAQRAFHLQNEWAAEAATAQQLGAEMRELMLGLPQRDPVTNDDLWGAEPDESGAGDFDDLDDFDGAASTRPTEAVRSTPCASRSPTWTAGASASSSRTSIPSSSRAPSTTERATSCA